MKISYLLSASLICFSSSISFAQTPTVKHVEKLFQVTQVEAITQQTLKQLQPQFQYQANLALQHRLKKSELSSQEQVIANQLAEKMYQHSLKTMAWSELKPLYIQAYQKVYTTQEIQAQIDFYQSKTGQSILHKSPQLALETSQLMQSRLSDLLKTATTDFQPIEKQIQQLEKK